MRIMTEHILPVRTQRHWFTYSIVAFQVVLIGLLIAHAAEAEQPCPPNLTDGGTIVSPASSCPGPPVEGSETADYRDPVAGVTLLSGRTTVNVSNTSELDAALPGRCGDTIVMANGTYTGTKTISTSCAANNPVIIRCANALVCEASGTWTVTGSRNIITGIYFNGNDAKVNLRGTNNKLIANRFRNWTPPAAITIGNSSGQSAPEIAYNLLGPGAPTTSGSYRWGIKAFTSTSSDSVPLDVWIHHNWFYQFISPDGRSDAIELGEAQYQFTPTFLAGTYIEDNLFSEFEYHGEALIDLKWGGSVIRRNTARDGDAGRFDARFGSYSIFESNYIENGGSTVHSTDNKIVCNYYGSGPGIRIMAGTVEWNQVAPKAHPRGRNALVSGNIGPLKVGHQSDERYVLAAQGTTIKDHTGAISFGLETGTLDNANEAGAYDCAPAVRLNTSAVGPSALTGATSAYKAARGF
jgi:hypothetical protein